LASDKQAIRRLLAEVVDSFEKLEILVHLHRQQFAPQAPATVAAALSLKEDEVTRCMDALKSADALDPNGTWAGAIAALAHMYEEDRIEVLDMMTRTALERVRKEAARLFADAFVLRPKKKGDSDG
jgi:hypothetical protein